MKEILNLLAVTSMIIIVYYVTLNYQLKKLNKCNVLYKLQE
jgi:hypothetical protein